MALKIFSGNVLDSQADAIILSIDGSVKGMEGNIARQFARRWPGVWLELQEEIRYPIPLGKVFAYEPVENCPFGLILFASTLHHRGVLNDAVKQGIIREATERSLKIATEYEVATVATSVMSGGWRLTQEEAFLGMIDGYDSLKQVVTVVNLDIYVLQNEDYVKIQNYASNIGWR